MRALCRQQVDRPRAQIEELVAERYGEPPADAAREPTETKPTPAMPPQAATATSVKVSAAEPLDGRDPNPREGA